MLSFLSVFTQTFESSASLAAGDADTAKSGLILPQFPFKKGAIQLVSPKKSTSQRVTFEQEFVWDFQEGFIHQNVDEKAFDCIIIMLFFVGV